MIAYFKRQWWILVFVAALVVDRMLWTGVVESVPPGGGRMFVGLIPIAIGILALCWGLVAAIRRQRAEG